MEYAIEDIEQLGVACVRDESDEFEPSSQGDGLAVSGGPKQVVQKHCVGMRLRSGAIVYLNHRWISTEGLRKKRVAAHWLEEHRRAVPLRHVSRVD